MRFIEPGPDNWKGRYEARVGGLTGQVNEHENRRHPRIPVADSPGLAFCVNGVPAPMKDISAGGMGFRSDEPYETGSELNVTLYNALNFPSLVVYCSGPIEDSTAEHGGFLVGVRFLVEDDGYRVAMLAMHHANGGSPF